MYIDATSKEDIELSLCNVLNKILMKYQLIDEAYNRYQKDKQVLILDELFDYFHDYANKNQVQDISDIMMFHLSKRLKDD